MQLKLIAAAIAVLALLGLGFYFGYKAAPTPEPVVQIVEKEKVVEIKGEERVVVRDRIVTVTKEIIRNPDGTVTEREIRTEAELNKEVDRRVTEVLKEREKTVTPVALKLPKYSLGLNLDVPTDRIGSQYRPNWKDVEITAGYRVFSSLWTVVEYKPDSRTLALGLSWQW